MCLQARVPGGAAERELRRLLSGGGLDDAKLPSADAVPLYVMYRPHPDSYDPTLPSPSSRIAMLTTLEDDGVEGRLPAHE